MKAHSMAFSTIIDGGHGGREHYHVPKYQREYTWGKGNWEQLLQDIDENAPGYFMGSVICVTDGEPAIPGDETIYEVVDGQQRLTTLSILLLGIYGKLLEVEKTQVFADAEEREDFQNTMSTLRNMLVKRKKKGEYRDGEHGGFIEQARMCFLRVQPSSQNNNLDDYKYMLAEDDLLRARDEPAHFRRRTFYKARKFLFEKLPEDLDGLLQLFKKIQRLTFVHISVASQADAFTLFETLNNRGVPLSAIDIIKNKMLAEMERQHSVDIDDSYNRWQELIGAVPESGDQERFLRQVYNAFRWDPAIRVDGIPRAMKSNIIAIYERLIKKDARKVFDRLSELADLYGTLVDPESNGLPKELQRNLIDLSRINAAPAYQILLYLFSLPAAATPEPAFKVGVVDLLCRYYVRRNVTDFPNTRDLDQAHMDLIEVCEKHRAEGGQLTVAFFTNALLKPGTFSSVADFRARLNGDMYSWNVLMTRYLLVKIDETYHSREYRPDLWARNEKDKYVWTVEHVLPQTDDIPKHWVEMIADGNRREAERVHDEHVDRLGNLTLSGYNSKLSTASFEKKQKLAENRMILGHEINIGYRNGLALNNLTFGAGRGRSNLATASTWNADMIEARTHEMVEFISKLYDLPSVDRSP